MAMVGKKQFKASMQAMFDAFNKQGSHITITTDDEVKPFIVEMLVDSYLVTRVAPPKAFWLFYKSVGYHEGFQYSHTHKIVRWASEDSYELDLEDDRGWQYHIELIFPELQPHHIAHWRKWEVYKARNRKGLERVARQLLEEHTEIARNWQKE